MYTNTPSTRTYKYLFEGLEERDQDNFLLHPRSRNHIHAALRRRLCSLNEMATQSGVSVRSHVLAEPSLTCYSGGRPLTSCFITQVGSGQNGTGGNEGRHDVHRTGPLKYAESIDHGCDSRKVYICKRNPPQEPGALPCKLDATRYKNLCTLWKRESKDSTGDGRKGN